MHPRVGQHTNAWQYPRRPHSLQDCALARSMLSARPVPAPQGNRRGDRILRNANRNQRSRAKRPPRRNRFFPATRNFSRKRPSRERPRTIFRRLHRSPRQTRKGQARKPRRKGKASFSLRKIRIKIRRSRKTEIRSRGNAVFLETTNAHEEHEDFLTGSNRS